jgi:hypothetical protein
MLKRNQVQIMHWDEIVRFVKAQEASGEKMTGVVLSLPNAKGDYIAVDEATPLTIDWSSVIVDAPVDA